MKKSCTIIISHYESLEYLDTCFRQIHKFANPEIEQKIIISDQSTRNTFETIRRKYMYAAEDITYINTPPLYSGHGIDNIIHNIGVDTDYICQLHADAFPIHKNWLLAPITLMEENNLAFSGLLQFVSDGTESIYPPSKGVFAMAQCFNIGRTDVYKEMSQEAGFTRFHNRPRSGLTFNNNDWWEWAKDDYNARGSDDDVVAFHWEDTHRQHNKMSFGLTGRIGVPGEESGYGTIIEDLVFHFGFHRESIGVMPQMGPKYKGWVDKIKAGYTDELVNELLAAAREVPLQPADMRRLWNGTTKTAARPAHSINQRFEELKNA